MGSRPARLCSALSAHVDGINRGGRPNLILVTCNRIGPLRPTAGQDRHKPSMGARCSAAPAAGVTGERHTPLYWRGYNLPRYIAGRVARRIRALYASSFMSFLADVYLACV